MVNRTFSWFRRVQHFLWYNQCERMIYIYLVTMIGTVQNRSKMGHLSVKKKISFKLIRSSSGILYMIFWLLGDANEYRPFHLHSCTHLQRVLIAKHRPSNKSKPTTDPRIISASSALPRPLSSAGGSVVVEIGALIFHLAYRVSNLSACFSIVLK